MRKIFNFFKDWIELIFLPIGILMWVFFPQIIHMIDPTAATYDSGIFQIIIFSIIQFFIFTSIVWVYLKITFPGAYRWLDDTLGDNLQKMSTWESAKVVLWIFSLLLMTIVLLSRVIS